MKAVADSSVLISLSNIGQLNLLKEMFSQVAIPKEVYEEVVTRGGDREGAKEVKGASWLKVLKVRDRSIVKLLRSSLDPGEAEVLALGFGKKFEYILVDEREARNMAKDLGMKVLGSIGVLIWGKRKGMIEEVKPLLKEMAESNFRISDELFSRVLKEVGEQP